MIFADYAGELFEDQACLEELGEFFAGVSNVLITLDGEKLCSYRDRTMVVSHAKVLLIEMQQAGIISAHTHLYIVCTKFDEIKKSTRKDVTLDFLKKQYKVLKETFEMKVEKMELLYLCAYGIDEEEEKKKM